MRKVMFETEEGLVIRELDDEGYIISETLIPMKMQKLAVDIVQEVTYRNP